MSLLHQTLSVMQRHQAAAAAEPSCLFTDFLLLIQPASVFPVQHQKPEGQKSGGTLLLDLMNELHTALTQTDVYKRLG